MLLFSIEMKAVVPAGASVDPRPNAIQLNNSCACYLLIMLVSCACYLLIMLVSCTCYLLVVLATC